MIANLSGDGVSGRAVAYYRADDPATHCLLAKATRDLPAIVERFLPGSLDYTLDHPPHIVTADLDHDEDTILGEVGENLTLTLDDRGLNFTLRNDGRPGFAEAVAALKAGHPGVSPTFRAIDERWSIQGGVYVRELVTVELLAISLTHRPGYEATAAYLPDDHRLDPLRLRLDLAEAELLFAEVESG